MLYIDTSASVKLVLAEAESAALDELLEASPGPLLTSRVGIVELRRVGRRAGAPSDRTDLIAAALTVIEMDATVETIAIELDPGLRALDAIHLASALAVGDALQAFVCYDERLVAAAQQVRLHVLSPGT